MLQLNAEGLYLQFIAASSAIDKKGLGAMILSAFLRQDDSQGNQLQNHGEKNLKMWYLEQASGNYELKSQMSQKRGAVTTTQIWQNRIETNGT